MQIGQDRSGFYSYTILENTFGADMPKSSVSCPVEATRGPEKRSGSATPKRFGGQGKMIPAIVEPARAFVHGHVRTIGRTSRLEAAPMKGFGASRSSLLQTDKLV